jgi:hypothetical protein
LTDTVAPKRAWKRFPRRAMTAKRNEKPGTKRTRRIFSREFKQEAVQMLLDGHSAGSVAKNLGIDNTA